MGLGEIDKESSGKETLSTGRVIKGQTSLR